MSMGAILSPTGRPRRGGVAPPNPPFLDLGDAEESAEEGGAEDAEQGAGTAELEPGRVESDALWQRAVNIAQPQLKGVRKNARQATALNAGNLHLLKQGFGYILQHRIRCVELTDSIGSVFLGAL
ncbi:hypothetical protein CGCFRS4_v015961 [Colletotrichum fructicola]|nr:hypothetical protein CGCFRS4_v015961 [Colletotrichum fructicola]